MTILDAVTQLRPGTSWHFDKSKGYESLQPADDFSSKVELPSQAELQAVIDAQEYREKRSGSYPPIGDQLDALWKGGTAASEMLTRIQAVKERFPKPEGAL